MCPRCPGHGARATRPRRRPGGLAVATHSGCQWQAPHWQLAGAARLPRTGIRRQCGSGLIEMIKRCPEPGTGQPGAVATVTARRPGLFKSRRFQAWSQVESISSLVTSSGAEHAAGSARPPGPPLRLRLAAAAAAAADRRVGALCRAYTIPIRSHSHGRGTQAAGPLAPPPA